MAKRQRRRRKREEWKRLDAEYRASGLSKREFAEARGLGTASLERWSRLLRREREMESETERSGLIELVADEPRTSPEVIDTDGVRLRVGAAVCLELPRWPAPDYVALIARAYEAVSPC